PGRRSSSAVTPRSPAWPTAPPPNGSPGLSDPREFLEGDERIGVDQGAGGGGALDRGTGQDLLDRYFQLLRRQGARHGLDLVDLVRGVPGRQVGPQFAGDLRAQVVVEVEAGREDDKEQ